MMHRIDQRFSVRGFTLVELMMSIGIMLLMTATVLWKYPDSTVKINLSNNTHQLALLVREAQLRGSSVDSINGNVGGYGVFLDSASSSRAILFKDAVDETVPYVTGLGVGNGIYDGLSSHEKSSEMVLLPHYSFKKLCVNHPTELTRFVCDKNNTPEIKTLTISFSRPNPEANMYINGATTTAFSSACIQLYSPKSPEIGHVRSVQIYHSGMVTTSQTSCD